MYAGELDLTMLKQICRAANLALVLESPDLPDLVKEVAPLLTQGKKLSSDIGTTSSRDHQSKAQHLNPTTSMADTLDSVTYKGLLTTLKLSNIKVAHQFTPDQYLSDEQLISSRSKKVKRFVWKGHTLTTFDTDPKKSIVEYHSVQKNDSPAFGQIHEIFHHIRRCSLTGQALQETFVSLLPFRQLSRSDALLDPFKEWKNMRVQLFYTPPSLKQSKEAMGSQPHLTPEVISLNQVRYHTASYSYPSGTFRIKHPTIAIKSLSRGRHNWS
jgi:hypothetical protein